MRFPSSDFVSGEFMLYHDSACQGEPSSGLSTGPKGYVHAPSQRAAASLCSDVHNRDMLAYRDFTKYSSQVIWWCLDPDEVPPSRGGNPTGGGPGDDGEPGDDADVDSSAPGEHSCQTLVETTNLKMTATYGLTSGIQCRRIGAAGVGNPTVTSRGVLDAVDIYGYAEQGYQLCFPQAGAIVFLDAATSPRAVVEVGYARNNGYTCAGLEPRRYDCIGRGLRFDARPIAKRPDAIRTAGQLRFDRKRHLAGQLLGGAFHDGEAPRGALGIHSRSRMGSQYSAGYSANSVLVQDRL